MIMNNRVGQFSCCLVGGDNLLIQCAEFILSQKHLILGMVTADRRVQEWAKENDIFCTDSFERLIQFLDKTPFDFLFSVINERVLPEALIKLPTKLAINYHDSLLPQYAGVHATSWALLNKETRHGISWHIMAKEVDAGDILKQAEVAIDKNETAISLNLKCYAAAINAFKELVGELAENNYQRSPQNLTQRSYYGFYQKPNNNWISWHLGGEDIASVCRALDLGPYTNKLALPKFVVNDDVFILKQVKVLRKRSRQRPGKMIKIDKKGIQVCTQSYDILILEASSTNGEDFYQYCQDKKIRRGHCLSSPTLDQVQQFNEFYQKIAKLESFWVHELKHISYTNFPFLIDNTATKDQKHVLMNTTDFAKLFKKKFWQKHDIAQVLLTAGLIYLYRINQQSSIGVSLSQDSYSEFIYPLVATAVPLSVKFEHSQHFFVALKHVKEKMTLVNNHISYLSDLKNRFPELKKTLTPSIAVVLADRQKNVNLLKITAPLVLLINPEKATLTLWVKKDKLNKNLQAVVKEIPNHLMLLLQGVEKKSKQAISTLSILSLREIDKITLKWNPAKTRYPHDKTVHQLFEAQVRKTPHQLAIVHGKKQLTYTELNQKANQLAHYLQSFGVGRETLVGILAERSIEFIIGVLAIIKAGGAYVPLDPKYPDTRIGYMLKDCNIDLLLSYGRYQERIKSFPEIQNIIYLDKDQALIENQAQSNLKRNNQADHLIYIVYTSGSTGQPKGIEIIHRGVVRLVKNTNYINLKPAECMAHISNLAFDAAVFEIWGALLNGMKLVIFENDVLFSPQQFKQQLSSHKVDTLCITPALFDRLIEAKPNFADGLKNIFFGGDRLSLANMVKVLKRKNRPQRIINGYGPAENTTCSTYYHLKDSSSLGSSVPIGVPIANTIVYVCDANGQLLPIGASGELYVGGDGLARGYLNKRELTAQKFIANPFNKKMSPKLYKTGDLVRWLPSGNLEFIGRIDNQVKIRGFRIELEEIEDVLAAHPDIAKAVVLFQKAESGRNELIAFIAFNLKNAMSSTEKIVRSYLKANLPEYMVPTAIHIVQEFPLTENGKIDKQKLLENINQNISKETSFSSRDKVQSLLATIWCKLLKLKTISLEENFFDLGGDSILAMQIASEAYDVGIQLTVKDIFEYQTIDKIAAHVKFLNKAKRKTTQKTAGNVPLTPIQSWFFNQNLNKVEQFSQACLLKMTVDIHEEHLEKCLNKLLQSYDAFCLRYKNKNKNWQQFYIYKNEPLTLKRHDFSSSQPAQLPELIKTVAFQLQNDFNLEKGPLFAASLIRASDDSVYLLLVAHHLIFDGISWRFFLNSLEKLYQHEDLATHGVFFQSSTFQDWANAVVQYAKKHMVKSLEKYWHEICNKKFQLPYGHSKGPNVENSSQVVEKALSVEETKLLVNAVVKKYNLKLDEVLLGVLVHVVAEWCSSSDVLIDLERHGREDVFDKVNLTNTIGWFTNLFPLYFTCGKDNSLIDTLNFVHQRLDTIQHNGVDYGMLHYFSKPKKQASRYSSPISFNYWGQFDSVFEENAFQFEWVQLISHADNLRSHVINVDAAVNKGQLSIAWTYSKNLHQQATIEKLLTRSLNLLRDLINKDVAISALDALPDFAFKINNPIAPLTPLQAGLLFHTINNPGCEAYVLQSVWALDESIDLELLQKSWAFLMKRHAILRSYFKWKGVAEPQRYVQHSVDLPWREYDWQDLSLKEYEARLDDFLKIDRQANFCLHEAPLLRIALIKLANQKYTQILSVHHILLDGWSIARVMAELGQVYESLSHSNHPNLPEAIPFEHYLQWLREQDLVPAVTQWRKYLSGFYYPVDSVLMDKPAITQLIDYAVDNLIFAKPVTQKIKQFCNTYQLTINSLMQGIWGLLLNRHSQSNDVVFGTTVSIRPPALEKAEQIIGALINTIPLRIKIDNHSKVVHYLKEIQTNFIELIEYAHAPLSDIQALSEIAPGSELFETLLIVENYPTLKIPGLNIKFDDIQIYDPTHYPLYIAVHLHEKLHVRFSYDKNRLTADKIKSLISHFQVLLLEAISKPNEKISQLELVSDPEKELIVAQWNNTQSAYPHDKTLVQLFEEQVKQSPQSTAVSFENHSLNYQQLNERVNQLAHYLRKQGAKPETIIALAMKRGLDMVIGMLAVIKAGAAYLPVDSSYPAERIRYMLVDSQAQFILTQSSLLNQLEELEIASAKLIAIDNLGFCEDESKDNPTRVSTPEQLLYIIYTSGSTGKPKGVLIEHRAVINFLYGINQKIKITAKDTWLAITPFSFDISGLEIYLPLLTGAHCMVASQDLIVDGKRLAALLDHYPISVLQATPMTWKMLLEAGWQNKQQVKILCGGEPLTKSLCEKLLKKTRTFWNLYGPTETTIWSTAHAVSGKDTQLPIVSIGRPIANTEVYVLNKQLKLNPIGVMGELYIGGDGVARGYLNQAGLTKERFIANPFSNQKDSRLYNTGDLVRWLPEGQLEYIGRNDEQVKIRGFRIELAEIQKHIEAYPLVKQAVVIGYTEPNSNDSSLTAFIIIRQHQDFNEKDLRAHLKKFLPDYMIPSSLMVVDQFPLTPNKKIDKNSLIQLAKTKVSYKVQGERPVTDEEKMVAKIWSEVLSIANNYIYRDSNFFELGGHSLTALQVLSSIYNYFHMDLEMRIFFENPTVMGLAERIRELSNDNTALTAATRRQSTNQLESCLVPLKPTGHKSPLFLVHPVGGTVFWYVALAKYLDPDRPLYGIQDPGVSLDKIPFNTIQEMAKTYIQAIRSIQPHGPYFIGGSSAGGNISVEMAHQLETKGEKIALVALLDSWAYYPDSLKNHEVFEGIMRRQYNMMQAKFLSKGITVADNLLKLQWQRSKMLNQYKPPLIHSKLIVFKAQVIHSIFDMMDHPLNHWQSCASQPVDAYMVPGDHETMFDDAHVQVLARLLNMKLSEEEILLCTQEKLA